MPDETHYAGDGCQPPHEGPGWPDEMRDPRWSAEMTPEEAAADPRARDYGTSDEPQTRAEAKAGPTDEPGETNQSLSELLRDAGLSEEVTVGPPVTEGMEQTPEDHQGTGDAMPRDPDLAHPEEIDDRFTEGRSYRLTDLLALWFDESVTRWAQGEQIIWDINLMAMPDPNQQGMFHPGLVIALSLKGAVINSVIYNTTVQQPFGLTREVVDAWCKQYIAELLNGRTQQLDEMSKQGAEAMANGRQAPGGGLILP